METGAKYFKLGIHESKIKGMSKQEMSMRSETSVPVQWFKTCREDQNRLVHVMDYYFPKYIYLFEILSHNDSVHWTGTEIG